MTRDTELLLLAALCLLGSMFGCATAARPAPVVVEAPGELAPSYNSIATAPVHAATDLSGGFQAIDGDSDAASVVAADGGDVEAPVVEAKAAHGF